MTIIFRYCTDRIRSLSARTRIDLSSSDSGSSDSNSDYMRGKPTLNLRTLPSLSEVPKRNDEGGNSARTLTDRIRSLIARTRIDRKRRVVAGS